MEAIDEEMFKFAHQVNQTTADKLREVLKASVEQGWSRSELKNTIAELYDDWADGGRADMIARTESTRAYTAGKIAAWKSTGTVTHKVWVCASDACPFCQDMDGTVIELDNNFFDEGDTQDVEDGDLDISMDHDYEDVGGPPLHPNCRCTVVGEIQDTDEEDEE